MCVWVGGQEEGVPAGNSVSKSTLPRLKSIVSSNPTQAAVVILGVVELFALPLPRGLINILHTCTHYGVWQ